MTVQQIINQYCIETFRIVVFLNWKTEVLFDSTKTNRDIPNFLYDSIVENVSMAENGILEIEV